jgi:hypothetical protein
MASSSRRGRKPLKDLYPISLRTQFLELDDTKAHETVELSIMECYNRKRERLHVKTTLHVLKLRLTLCLEQVWSRQIQRQRIDFKQTSNPPRVD